MGEVGHGMCAVAHVFINGAVVVAEDVHRVRFRCKGFALSVTEDFDGERFVLEMAAVCGYNELHVLAFDFHA